MGRQEAPHSDRGRCNSDGAGDSVPPSRRLSAAGDQVVALHVALLRAINVGGRTVKMDALRTICEEMGLTKVETFIASGNVIFESRAGAAVLEKKIEAHLRKVLGYEVA